MIYGYECMLRLLWEAMLTLRAAAKRERTWSSRWRGDWLKGEEGGVAVKQNNNGLL